MSSALQTVWEPPPPTGEHFDFYIFINILNLLTILNISNMLYSYFEVWSFHQLPITDKHSNIWIVMVLQWNYSEIIFLNHSVFLFGLVQNDIASFLGSLLSFGLSWLCIQEKQYFWSSTKQPRLAGGGRPLSQESKPGVVDKDKDKDSLDKLEENSIQARSANFLSFRRQEPELGTQQ